MDPQPGKKDDDSPDKQDSRPPTPEADNEDSSPGGPDQPKTPAKRLRSSGARTSSAKKTHHGEGGENPQAETNPQLETETQTETAPKPVARYLTFDPDAYDYDEIHTSDSDNFTVNHSIGDRYKVSGLIYGVRGARNTCICDPFLTSLKLWSLRSKYDFERNFRHTDGPGLILENNIRQMIRRLYINSLLITDIETALADTADLQSTWVCTMTGERPDKPIDLLGSPDTIIHDHIESVSKFAYLYRCGCKKKFEIKLAYKIHFSNPEQLRRFVSHGLIPDRSIKGSHCEKCNSPWKCKLLIPEETWVLIFTYGLGVKKDELPLGMAFNDDILFRLGYTVYNRTYLPIRDPPPKVEIVDLEAETDFIIDLEGEEEKAREEKTKEPRPGSSKEPRASASKKPQVQGHMTARICLKEAFFRYDDMRNNGQLTYVLNRQPPEDPQTRMDSSIYFRNPPRRTRMRSLFKLTSEAERKEKEETEEKGRDWKQRRKQKKEYFTRLKPEQFHLYKKHVHFHHFFDWSPHKQLLDWNKCKKLETLCFYVEKRP